MTSRALQCVITSCSVSDCGQPDTLSRRPKGQTAWTEKRVSNTVSVTAGNICSVMARWSREQLLASSWTVQWALAAHRAVPTAAAWKPRQLWGKARCEQSLHVQDGLPATDDDLLLTLKALLYALTASDKVFGVIIARFNVDYSKWYVHLELSTRVLHSVPPAKRSKNLNKIAQSN